MEGYIYKGKSHSTVFEITTTSEGPKTLDFLPSQNNLTNDVKEAYERNETRFESELWVDFQTKMSSVWFTTIEKHAWTFTSKRESASTFLP